jgi:hypothetical protein
MFGTSKRRGNIKMIKITLTNGESRIFENYHEVCEYINTIERTGELESGKAGWRFIRRRHDTLQSLYYRNPSLKDYLTSREREAVEKQQGLIEILKGGWETVTQILYTTHLDLEALKRDWCKEYCAGHELKMSEWVLKN